MKFRNLIALTVLIFAIVVQFAWSTNPAIYSPQNSYRNMSDGSTTLTAAGEDTVTFTSTDNSVNITAYQVVS